jgi:hypothetical protein
MEDFLMNRFTIVAGALFAGLVSQTPSFAENTSIDNSRAGDAAMTSGLNSAARENWRSIMARNPPAAEGCFHATLPDLVWESKECKITTPRVSPVHTERADETPEVVGDQNDYAAYVQGLLTAATGSIRTTGVTSETGVGTAKYNYKGILGPNEYSLQINTQNYINTSACKNGASNCTVWQQFVYAPDYNVKGEAAVFMQYWLLNWGSSKCPSGWTQSVLDCWKDSRSAVAPDLPITDLNDMTLSAAAFAGGNDILTFYYGTEAYVITGKDSVLNIATVWNSAEFNVVGNGGGSEAAFNLGSTVDVYLELADGSNAAPECVPSFGTTGETNNLNLGSCIAAAFGQPYIQFSESLPFPTAPIKR